MPSRAHPPSMPPAVAAAYDAYPAPARQLLLSLRQLVLDTAAGLPGVGPLTETLKWGEPAYLTAATRSGSTIRLGTTSTAREAPAVLFNCKTTLVETMRSHFADVFAFEGNRALIVPLYRALPHEPLKLCLHLALTYHRSKGP